MPTRPRDLIHIRKSVTLKAKINFLNDIMLNLNETKYKNIRIEINDKYNNEHDKCVPNDNQEIDSQPNI